MRHLQLRWVGQLWQSELLFFGRYVQKTLVFSGYSVSTDGVSMMIGHYNHYNHYNHYTCITTITTGNIYVQHLYTNGVGMMVGVPVMVGIDAVRVG